MFCLVDRIALRDQALDAFKEHLPNEPRWPKQGEKEIVKDRPIYVSTYPTILNVIRNDEKTLSPHFFDLIVVDESHRSIYNTYQEVLDYFNTITLGLTATPTDVIDHNTFQLFETEDGLFGYSKKKNPRLTWVLVVFSYTTLTKYLTVNSSSILRKWLILLRKRGL